MATFMMFGNYTKEALDGAGTARTRKAGALVRQHGGKVKGMYALLGAHDLVLIVDLPDMASAIQVSIGLQRLTGVSFRTAPAVDVKEFDKLLAAG